MIAAHDEDLDSGFMQPPDLLGKEPSGFHRGLVAIIEIACQQQRIDLLVETKVDDFDKGAAGCVPNQLGEFGIAQRQRP